MHNDSFLVEFCKPIFGPTDQGRLETEPGERDVCVWGGEGWFQQPQPVGVALLQGCSLSRYVVAVFRTSVSGTALLPLLVGSASFKYSKGKLRPTADDLHVSRSSDSFDLLNSYSMQTVEGKIDLIESHFVGGEGAVDRVMKLGSLRTSLHRIRLAAVIKLTIRPRLLDYVQNSDSIIRRVTAGEGGSLAPFRTDRPRAHPCGSKRSREPVKDEQLTP